MIDANAPKPENQPEPGAGATRSPGRAEMAIATAMARIAVMPRRRVAAIGLAAVAGAVALALQFTGPSVAPAPVATPQPAAPKPAAPPTGRRALAALPDMPGDPAMPPALSSTPLRVQTLRAETPDCTVTVEATRLATATVALEIAAPCDARDRVDVIQGDLEFATRLDAEGRAALDVPALSAAPTFGVTVEGRDPVVTLGEAGDLSDYRRVALQWAGPAGPELHAFEDGAGFGGEGHVSPEYPRTIARALSGNGGYIVTLGDPDLAAPRLAQVYTAPADQPVTIAVDVAVTEDNCARPLIGRTIQSVPGTPADTQPLTVAMPDCEAAGDILMLGDLPAPEAVAAK